AGKNEGKEEVTLELFQRFVEENRLNQQDIKCNLEEILLVSKREKELLEEQVRGEQERVKSRDDEIEKLKTRNNEYMKMNEAFAKVTNLLEKTVTLRQ
ncbi:hypothetical protein PENTCL1PPCAC_10937, partial [Pristionchus entomophagus]